MSRTTDRTIDVQNAGAGNCDLHGGVWSQTQGAVPTSDVIGFALWNLIHLARHSGMMISHVDVFTSGEEPAMEFSVGEGDGETTNGHE